jgi:hypothetical protein
VRYRARFWIRFGITPAVEDRFQPHKDEKVGRKRCKSEVPSLADGVCPLWRNTVEHA